MTDMQTMVRTELAIDGSSFFLAQGQNVEGLQHQIEAATQTAGTFVKFVVVGNRTVSVLITPRSRVVLSVETVQFDPRDDGNDEFPFGGIYDFLA